MRPLTLDFLHPLPRPHWAAWGLLAAGLALAGWVGWQGQQVQQALDEAVAAAPRPSARSALRAAGTSSGAAADAVQSARQQLAAPWGRLFARLEANRPKNIALVALEADARKTEASLTAEARNARDMLAYIEQLKNEAGFPSVTLTSHILQESDPQLPLRFVLRLSWRS